jgi:hypothetical protein
MLETSVSIEGKETNPLLQPQLSHAESAGSVLYSGKRINSPQKPSSERSPFNQPKEHDIITGLDRSKTHLTELSSFSRAAIKSSTTSFNDSPSKVPHYIRAIPEQNLFTEPLPEDLKHFPFFVLFNCSRLANEHQLSLHELLRDVDGNSARTDPINFLDQICGNLNLPTEALRYQQKYWSASKKDFEGFSFKARIDFVDPDARKMLSMPVL